MKFYERLLFLHTTRCITIAQTTALTASNTNVEGLSSSVYSIIKQMSVNNYDTVLHRDDDALYPLTELEQASQVHSMHFAQDFTCKGSSLQPLVLHVHLQQVRKIAAAESRTQETTTISKVYLQSYWNEEGENQVWVKVKFCITNHFLILKEVHFY